MAGAEEIDGAMSSLLREMHAEGHIDNQFEQLLMLQDESEPDFVRSVMELFFQVRVVGELLCKDEVGPLTQIHDILSAGDIPSVTSATFVRACSPVL